MKKSRSNKLKKNSKRKRKPAKSTLALNEKNESAVDAMVNNIIREKMESFSTTRVPFSGVMEQRAPSNIDEINLTRKDIQNVVYAKTMSGYSTSAQLDSLDILKYIGQLTDDAQPPWFISSQNAIIEADLEFPSIVAIHRSHLLSFMEECEPNNPRHRPCSRGHECESFRLSEHRAPGQGFVCRELLMPIKWSKIKSVSKSHAAEHLPGYVGWCVLCHLANTTRIYLENYNRVYKRGADTENRPLEDGQCHMIHNFIVYVDIQGEYRLDRTLLGDTQPMGIFGPYPIYSPLNYEPSTRTRNDRKCWLENENLVFRLPPVDLRQVESSPTTEREQGKHLCPSDPM